DLPQSATTTAAATESVWVSDTCQERTPRASARSAARPDTSRLGAPEAPVTTWTSAKRTPPSPVPSAFIVASLAAKRAARPGTGSTRSDTNDRSWAVKIRSAIWGRRARICRKRSTSTASTPRPITAGPRKRPVTALRKVRRSLDCDDLGEIARAVHVVSPLACHAVSKDLKGHDGDNGRQQLGQGGDLECQVRRRRCVAVALVAHCHDGRAPRLYLRDVGHDLLPQPASGRDGDDDGRLVDERYRPVLHLSCGVRLGPDISELFQLERTLEGDAVADATTEEVDVFDLGEA